MVSLSNHVLRQLLIGKASLDGQTGVPQASQHRLRAFYHHHRNDRIRCSGLGADVAPVLGGYLPIDDPCYPALGSQGMEDLVKRLFKAAGVAGFTGHDLRRTFISLVTEVSGDELLGMRLARDRVPGVNDRYVSRDLPALLAEFSPLSLLRGT